MRHGGRYAAVPAGYWVDVTSLAAAYGWERLPALSSWRTYYEGARYTEFVMTGGMDWYAAMLELYPPEILVTPTKVLPPTVTPSRTPIPTSTPGPTRTPRPDLHALQHRHPAPHHHAQPRRLGHLHAHRPMRIFLAPWRSSCSAAC